MMEVLVQPLLRRFEDDLSERFTSDRIQLGQCTSTGLLQLMKERQLWVVLRHKEAVIKHELQHELEIFHAAEVKDPVVLIEYVCAELKFDLDIITMDVAAMRVSTPLAEGAGQSWKCLCHNMLHVTPPIAFAKFALR